ncbi:hypothetical protein LCGC14_2586830 [marine sediment metagenome]|uniref:DUF559 domain-containing protein n=1 Tax=marine sediment metagenome TaxID=412755 RepID=A0A0F9ACR2_9ZZZZ
MTNKYGARRTWSELCQREFASMKECRRAEELALLEKAGEITCLRFQVPYVLSVKPKVTITIDFSYIERMKGTELWCGQDKHEDSKGVLTRDTRTKLAWLKEKHGIDVILS